MKSLIRDQACPEFLRAGRRGFSILLVAAVGIALGLARAGKIPPAARRASPSRRTCTPGALGGWRVPGIARLGNTASLSVIPRGIFIWPAAVACMTKGAFRGAVSNLQS